VQAGFLCSLPSKIDFGAVPVGTTGTPRQINVHNDGSAALTINGVRVAPREYVGGGEFVIANNHCVPGSALAPGATCTVDLAPAAGGGRHAQGDGDHRHLGRPLSNPAFRRGNSCRHQFHVADGIRAQRRGVVVECAGRIGIRLGAHARPPGRRDLRDLVYLRCERQGDVAHDVGLAFGSRHLRRNADSNRRPRARFDPVQFGAGAAHRRGQRELDLHRSGSGTFAYTVNGISQSKPITRMLFGAQPACTFGGTTNPALATNFQGNWWTAGGGESGWGMYFTHQGDTIFVSWFAYDLDGTPLWLTATATKAGNGLYRGT
jgi:hypothetical protein